MERNLLGNPLTKKKTMSNVYFVTHFFYIILEFSRMGLSSYKCINLYSHFENGVSKGHKKIHKWAGGYKNKKAEHKKKLSSSLSH